MASTDAIPVPRKNTAFRMYFAIRDTAGALVTSWAGADSEVSKDGGSFADCTNEATEIGTSGCGYIDLTSTEMNADSVVYKLTVTNTNAISIVVTLYPESVGDYRIDTTTIDAIKFKTDALPSDPADQSVVIAATDAILTAVGTRATQTSVDDLPTNAELTTAIETSDDAMLSAIAAEAIKTAAIKVKTDLITTGIEIADAVLSRSVATVEGSAAEHSLCTVVLAMLENSISGTTLTIKRTNGSTTHVTKTLSTNANADPITGIT